MSSKKPARRRASATKKVQEVREDARVRLARTAIALAKILSLPHVPLSFQTAVKELEVTGDKRGTKKVVYAIELPYRPDATEVSTAWAIDGRLPLICHTTGQLYDPTLHRRLNSSRSDQLSVLQEIVATLTDTCIDSEVAGIRLAAERRILDQAFASMKAKLACQGIKI